MFASYLFCLLQQALTWLYGIPTFAWLQILRPQSFRLNLRSPELLSVATQVRLHFAWRPPVEMAQNLGRPPARWRRRSCCPCLIEMLGKRLHKVRGGSNRLLTWFSPLTRAGEAAACIHAEARNFCACATELACVESFFREDLLRGTYGDPVLFRRGRISITNTWPRMCI